MTSQAGIHARFNLSRSEFVLDVDLELPARGVIALFGESGAGKTTLLRCVAGLERAQNGYLRVNGEVWQDESRWLPTHRRSIGYVFQEASLFSHLSVKGNLLYGQKRLPDARRMSLEHAIELLGIGALLDRRPHQLSGGERQRVGIARALAVNPRLLLMDEPLASLDVPRKLEILPFLERLHDELDIPVLYVSHAPDEVARIADYLVAMRAGRVLAHGPLAATLARLDLPIKLGEETATIIDATVGAIDGEWQLMRVDFTAGSLWTRACELPVGHRVRVRVLARDVSLATQEPAPSSIQNVLRATVDAIGDDEHPGLMLVRVRLGNDLLLAQLTRRSAAGIGIAPGRDVWVQVKSVALLERAALG